MAYEKTEWTTGDVITAEKLNHMEDGIDDINNKILIVHGTEDDDIFILDQTWKTINDAVRNGFIVTLTREWAYDNTLWICSSACAYSGSSYNVVFQEFNNSSNSFEFYAMNEDEYPILHYLV